MSKLCKDCACENVCGITHLPEDKACGFYYKAEAVAELEKIKEEIGKLPKQGYFISSDGTMGGYRERSAEDYEVDVLNIIDNHIMELKGEKNETDN